MSFSSEMSFYRVDFQGAKICHSLIIPFTGTHAPHKLTCVIAHLVRALHRHREGHGFEYR